MPDVRARPSYPTAAGVGAAAGLVGSVVQVLVGLLLDKAVLPRGQDNNIAPRFVTRLFQSQGEPANPARDWALGTAFHLGYGVGWGAAYGLARRRTGLPPSLLGVLTGLLIYLLAFSGFGAGTKTRTEPPPHRRGWRKQASLVAVAWTFALTTAAVYERLTRRAPEPEGAPEEAPTPSS
jgi:hypothetical protein